MKNLLLAAGLLLAGLSTGCKKSDADPTPAPTPTPSTTTLLATWQIDSTYQSGGTAATVNQKNKLQLFAPGKASIVFTATKYSVYAGTQLDKEFAYTQVNNVIHIDPIGSAIDVYSAATIKTLTPKRLVLTSLQSQQNGQVNQYAFTTVTYSR